MKSLVAIVVIALTGCTQLMPYKDMQQQTPRYEGDSAKSASEVIACVMPRWLATSDGTKLIQDKADQVITVPYGNLFPGKMTASLVVKSTPNGSRLVYRDLSSSQTSNYAKRSTAVMFCK